MSFPRDERRVHPRLPRSVELSGSAVSGGTSARLVSSDLSLGGAYCTSDRAFPEMTRLAVRLLLPAQDAIRERAEPIELAAVVVRHKRLLAHPEGERHELALLFTSMSPVHRERLAHYLSHS